MVSQISMNERLFYILLDDPEKFVLQRHLVQIILRSHFHTKLIIFIFFIFRLNFKVIKKNLYIY